LRDALGPILLVNLVESFAPEHGFEVRGPLENYIEDEADDGWATPIVWDAD
jgi:hypothetical protein